MKCPRLNIPLHLLEVLPYMTETEAGKLFKALYEYRSEGTKCDLSGSTKKLFKKIQYHIDKEKEDQLKISEVRRAAGLLGGRPKKETASSVPDNNVKEHNKSQPTEVSENESKPTEVKKKTRRGFVKPSEEEVQKRIDELAVELNWQPNFDAKYFISYCDDNDWRTADTSKPIKNWRGYVRVFFSKDMNDHPKQQVPVSQSLTKKTYTEF